MDLIEEKIGNLMKDKVEEIYIVDDINFLKEFKDIPSYLEEGYGICIGNFKRKNNTSKLLDFSIFCHDPSDDDKVKCFYSETLSLDRAFSILLSLSMIHNDNKIRIF